MHEVRDVLQKLRSLDQDISRLVEADTVSSSEIVPAIESRFLPRVKTLFKRVGQLQPPQPLQKTHRLLAKYLAVRQEAFAAAVAGHAEGSTELLADFKRLQTVADGVGKDLEDELRQVRRYYPD